MGRDVSRTTAQRNRLARQEALREYIAKQRHEQQAFEAIEKIREAADQFEASKWAKVFDAHMRLLDKYLPAQKEVSMEFEGTLDADVDIRRVNVRGVGSNGNDA